MAEEEEKKAPETAEAPPHDKPESSRAPAPRSDEPAEEDDEEPDAASPEAILRRVSALDEEGELDRVAREEEKKLAERRRAAKKSKKSGLEAAASKRLAKIGTKAAPKRTVPVAVDADPLIDRATRLAKWAEKNQGTVQAGVAVVLLAGAALGGYAYWQSRREANASVELAKAVADERGRIGDPDKDEDDGRFHDPRPVFKTVEARRDTALGEYQAVESKYKGTGAAILARLSAGSLLLDKDDAKGALQAFEDVAASPLAKVDREVKGRALEGEGFAYELQAEAPGADGKGPLEEAMKVYKTLENTDTPGFAELGLYHQSRILVKEGQKDQAVELLKKLRSKLNEPGESHVYVYLETVSEDALRSLDPSALPPKTSPGAPGAHGKNPMDQAQMKKLIEQLQKQAKEKPPAGGAGGGAPPEHGEAPK